MKKLTLLLSVFLYLGLGAGRAQVTNLFNFSDSNGSDAWGSLIVSGNVLYGTTGEGGVNENGVIFSINNDGSGYKQLWNFNDAGSAGNANGEYPGIALTLSGNKLYGVTWEGGSNGQGLIYSINTNGSGYKDLWDFNDTGSAGNANGEYAQCTLVLLGGKLYGMTPYGGSNGSGLIYSINTNGSGYRDLWDFDDTGSNGANPYGSLTLSLSGKVLYGMTDEGGTNGYGNVFSIDTNGTYYKDLFNFNSGDGSYPDGSLALSGNKFYGMTGEGGEGYGEGVIFSLDTDGTRFKELLQFNITNGADPEGSLVVSGNLLYGMTDEGGLYGYQSHGNGNGVVFSMDTSGGTKGYTDLFDFNTTDGAYPYEDVTLVGGTLYGMASEGGANNDGTIFSYDLCSLLTSRAYKSATDTGACSGVAAITPSGGPMPFTYLWQDGQTTDTITGVCQGTYSCIITDNNGCSTTASVTVGNITGINEVKGKSEEVKVYPNPSDGMFTVALSHAELARPAEPFGRVSASQTIEIYNILGEQVYTSTLPPPNGGGASSVFQINLSSQPNGIYLYRVTTNNGELIGEGKVIIQR